MITLLSPAKRLDDSSPTPSRRWTTPRQLDDSAALIARLRTLSATEVGSLLGISPELAALNVERYHEWQPPFTRRNSRPAVFTFAGDTYVGLDAAGRFDARDLTHAQKTIRILSGLYGLLRPLDLIQPYRLEMGTALATERGRDLYDFWTDAVTTLLRADLDASPGAGAIINLASSEYMGAVDVVALDAPVIAPRFEDESPSGSYDESPSGSYKVMSFYAKQARGDMAGWLVTNRVRSPRALCDYAGRGYRYCPELSTPATPVFRRPREWA